MRRRGLLAVILTMLALRLAPALRTIVSKTKYTKGLSYSYFSSTSTRLASTTSTPTPEVSELLKSITAKGEEIKALKAEKPPTLKEDLAPLVEQLIELKTKYKNLTGEEIGGSIKDKRKKEKASKKAAEDGAERKRKEEGGISMEEIVNLCKSRGFVFQSSEIYQSYPGFFDYGPLGVELKNNIKKLWWRDMVQRREDMVGLDSSIIASPEVWKASGHIDGFSDPMVDCKETKLRFRADQVFWAKVETADGMEIGYVSVLEADDMAREALSQAKKLAVEKGLSGEIKTPITLQELTQCPKEIYPLIPSPATGNQGDLTEPRDFNLMFQTNVGANTESSNIAYLRPETAQGIFINYQQVQRTARMKIPFGIAQIGKAFRNEITPRNFIFRSREFEQMEIEYFISPDDNVWKKEYQKWIDISWNWLKSIGLREDLMFKYEQADLAHYARACTDITFKFPFGTQELMGIAARGNYDLTAHASSSGTNLEYFDETNKQHFIPHVIEPSCGVDRLFLALLSSAYAEEEVEGEIRKILRFHPSIAPIKIAVFPLVKNKAQLTDKARNLFEKLQMRYMCVYDTAGTIGRRYRRADESGIPYCVTIDFESLENDSVTIRDRDTMEQTRMKIDDLFPYISKAIDGF